MTPTPTPTQLARHAYSLTSDTHARFPREDSREEVGVGVGVGVVECELNLIVDEQ